MARFLLLFIVGCHSTSEAKPSAPAQVTLLTASGEAARVDIELATTPQAREHGLMERREMAPNHGMLFVFAHESAQTFWMKNTFIPLDLVFIRQDLTIAGIVADAEPMTLTPRGVSTPSLYVLEVVGGYAAAHHLAAGDRVKLDNVPSVTN